MFQKNANWIFWIKKSLISFEKLFSSCCHRRVHVDLYCTCPTLQKEKKLCLFFYIWALNYVNNNYIKKSPLEIQCKQISRHMHGIKKWVDLGRNGFQKAVNMITLSFFYIHTLLLCLGVCLFFPIIVKTAEPIGPKFFLGPNVTPGKFYGWLNFQNLHLPKSIFWKFFNSLNFFIFVLQFLHSAL